MNTMDQTQYLNHLMLDPNQQYVYYNQQQMLLQQQELQRISQVQQQAAYQQQRALMYQQTMMHYEQQMMMDQYHHDYDSGSASSPPQEGQLSQGITTMGKAQKRAEHNAIERARRESLNSKFQQLAHSLPNLQDDRRPSKGTIIERTLEYVKQTVRKEERFQTEIEKLRQANESLISKITTNEPIEELLDELDDDCQSSVTSGTSNDMYLFEQDASATTLLVNKEFL